MAIESEEVVRSLRGAEATGEAVGSLPRAFTSKIGRLPEAVRLELNERILVILRRADYYGVKVGEDCERAAIELERARKKAEQDEPLSPEEERDRIDHILGTGRFECRWDTERKIWVGPGVALHYEEEEVETLVREEMLRRSRAIKR